MNLVMLMSRSIGECYVVNNFYVFFVDFSETAENFNITFYTFFTILGPILLLIFINDLDTRLTSNVLKFVDDTKSFRVVDCQMLQNDLDNISKWADSWQMKFNVEKCKVLHYGRSSIEHSYLMHGHPLEQA